MTWSEIFGVFTKPLFQLGQTWISLATMVEFVVVTAIVVVASRLIRHVLRNASWRTPSSTSASSTLSRRIVSYIVLVFGLLIGVETMGVNLSSLAVIDLNRSLRQMIGR